MQGTSQLNGPSSFDAPRPLNFRVTPSRQKLPRMLCTRPGVWAGDETEYSHWVVDVITTIGRNWIGALARGMNVTGVPSDRSKGCLTRSLSIKAIKAYQGNE